MPSAQQSHDSSRCESGSSACTVCRGSALILTRLSPMLVTTSHFRSFYLAFSLHLLVCSSAPPCPTALPEAPAQLRSCPSVSSSAHPPQSLVSPCSSSGQELLGPSTAPSPPARQQTVPRAPLLCRGTGKDGSSSAGDGSSQPQLPLSPQPPCASPVAVRGCNQQRKTC